MKTYKITAAVIGSFVLGAGAASVLHAQSKPPAYVIAEVDVRDRDGFTNDFLPKVLANTKEHGGVYLAGGFDKAIGFAGFPPQNRVVLIQFPSMDQVKAFYEKNRPLEREVGSKYASIRVMAIEGVEQK